MSDEPFKPKPKRKKPVRETGRGGIEQTGRKHVERIGGESWKMVSPGLNGVPDQVELYGADAMVAKAQDLNIFMTRDEAVEILAAAIQFTEYKAPNKEPTTNQLRVHGRLKARGFTVNVVDYFRK